MNPNRTTLLTGSTGFIGQYVLRDLLLCGERVAVLLRGSRGSSRLRLAEIMGPLGIDVEHYLSLGRLMIYEGHLPDLLPRIRDLDIDQIVHSAACLQTASDDAGEPFATNVEGAKMLAEWADEHRVEHFHFVSTAYTCGREKEIAHEEIHQPQPKFHTDYEYSKWIAEDFLTNWAQKSGRAITILRPSLVVGDSQTGFTTQYGGFYQLAHMVEVLERFFSDKRSDGSLYLPMRIPAQPQDPQNLVTVDYVSQAVVHIVTHQEHFGGIYHITNPSPPLNHEVKEWFEEYYSVWGGHFVDEVDESVSESLAESMFLKLNELVLLQFKFVPQFDCSNTLRVLGDSTIRCPRLDRDLAFELLDYARSQNWGRASKAAIAS